MTWATPRRILVAGWLGFLLYAYPGYLRGDSADQLVDSRVGEFTDWHSPMMTQVWRLVGFVVSGPAGMLFLQSLLLLLGSYVLLRRAMSDRIAALTACGVLLFPPVLATEAVIAPEAQLASFLVAGAAALTSERHWHRLAGLGLLVVAAGMRDGAALAVLPIVVGLFAWRADHARWQRLGIALAVSAAVVLVAAGLVRLFVDVHSQRTEVTRAMFDIAGTLRFAGDASDEALREPLATAPLAVSSGFSSRGRAVYGRAGRYAGGDEPLFVPPATAEQIDGLLTARRALALAQPGGYLRHRLHVLQRVLELKRSNAASPLYTKFVADPAHREALHHAARHSLVQGIVIRPVRALSQTFVFRPYLYAVLAIVLLALAITWRQRVAMVVLASAVCHELAVAFTTVRPDFAESHTLIVATVLAVTLLVAHRFRTAA